MTAPAEELQLAIRPAPGTSTAINQTVRPAFRLFDLPVELQDSVLEYVCVLPLAFFPKAALSITNSSTADLEQRYQERLPGLQTLPSLFDASAVQPHGS